MPSTLPPDAAHPHVAWAADRRGCGCCGTPRESGDCPAPSAERAALPPPRSAVLWTQRCHGGSAAGGAPLAQLVCTGWIFLKQCPHSPWVRGHSRHPRAHGAIRLVAALSLCRPRRGRGGPHRRGVGHLSDGCPQTEPGCRCPARPCVPTTALWGPRPSTGVSLCLLAGGFLRAPLGREGTDPPTPCTL